MESPLRAEAGVVDDEVERPVRVGDALDHGGDAAAHASRGRRSSTSTPAARRPARCSRSTPPGHGDDRHAGGASCRVELLADPAGRPVTSAVVNGSRHLRYCRLERPHRADAADRSAQRDEDRHGVVADLDEAAVRRRSAARCRRPGRPASRTATSVPRNGAWPARKATSPSVVRVDDLGGLALEQHLLGRHDGDVHGVPRRRGPSAITTLLQRLGLGLHLLDAADVEERLLGHVVELAVDDAPRSSRPSRSTGTYSPLRPVNTSATKNGWDRNRCTLRARFTVRRSSSDSSSRPRMAMMSCSSL